MNEDDTLSNSHFGMPKAQAMPVGIFNENLPTYEEGDVAALHMDDRGRLLVAVDGVSEAAQQKIIELTTIENNLRLRLHDKTNAAFHNSQKVNNKHLHKMRKIALQRDKFGDLHDESMTKTNNRAKAVISGRRYAFLATFVRWAAIAGSAITMTYFLS